eukprot:Amastigsp_a843160_36.p2 type:complete len:242 gc:universal Amastigsp_a843160_36:846-121(-)
MVAGERIDELHRDIVGLLCEFARGREDETNRTLLRDQRHSHLVLQRNEYHGKCERQGLARARERHADHVAPAEDDREPLNLDGCRAHDRFGFEVCRNCAGQLHGRERLDWRRDAFPLHYDVVLAADCFVLGLGARRDPARRPPCRRDALGEGDTGRKLLHRSEGLVLRPSIEELGLLLHLEGEFVFWRLLALLLQHLGFGLKERDRGRRTYDRASWRIGLVEPRGSALLALQALLLGGHNV